MSQKRVLDTDQVLRCCWCGNDITPLHSKVIIGRMGDRPFEVVRYLHIYHRACWDLSDVLSPKELTKEESDQAWECKVRQMLDDGV